MDIALPVRKKHRLIVDQPICKGRTGEQKRTTGRTSEAEATLQRNKGTPIAFQINKPIVVEQILQVLGDHHNHHPSVEKLKLTEIVQNQNC